MSSIKQFGSRPLTVFPVPDILKLLTWDFIVTLLPTPEIVNFIKSFVIVTFSEVPLIL